MEVGLSHVSSARATALLRYLLLQFGLIGENLIMPTIPKKMLLPKQVFRFPSDLPTLFSSVHLGIFNLIYQMVC